MLSAREAYFAADCASPTSGAYRILDAQHRLLPRGALLLENGGSIGHGHQRCGSAAEPARKSAARARENDVSCTSAMLSSPQALPLLPLLTHPLVLHEQTRERSRRVCLRTHPARARLVGRSEGIADGVKAVLSPTKERPASRARRTMVAGRPPLSCAGRRNILVNLFAPRLCRMATAEPRRAVTRNGASAYAS